VSESRSVTEDTEENSTMRKEFFKRISGHFHDVLHYEDPNLQRKARSVIPIKQLEIAVMKKMRNIQK